MKNAIFVNSELYDKFAGMNCIDQAIFESEQEVANGAEAIDAETVFAELVKCATISSRFYDKQGRQITADSVIPVNSASWENLSYNER